MNGRFLLDSNIVIALFSGEQAVVSRLSQPLEIYLPVIVVGELYYGAFNSSKQVTNIERIDQFKAQVPVLDIDEYTAKIYGSVKKELKTNGTPIPENDIWIAAIAIQHKLTIVTRDKHFEVISQLSIEGW